MTPFEMYSERAEECRREAESTTLINVRTRCLRAAAAWQEMADRAFQAEGYRSGEAARKAQQQTSSRGYYFIAPLPK